MEGLTGQEVTETLLLKENLIASENPYAYLFEWNEYFAPKALYMLFRMPV